MGRSKNSDSSGTKRSEKNESVCSSNQTQRLTDDISSGRENAEFPGGTGTSGGIPPFTDQASDELFVDAHDWLEESAVVPSGAMVSDNAAVIREVNAGIAAIKADIMGLSDLMLSELQQAGETIASAQSAAAASQSDILRTMTQAIFASSAASGGSTDEIENLFLRFEDRIAATFRQVVQSMAVVSDSAVRTSADGARSEIASSNVAKNPASASGSRDSAAKAGSPAPAMDSEAGTRQSWDEIRRAFLNNSPELKSDDAAPSKSSAFSSGSSSVTNTGASGGPKVPAEVPAELIDNEVPLEIPAQVNPDILSEPELREVLAGRDRLISALISRLRRQTYAHMDQMTTEQLREISRELPDELNSRVIETLRRMDEQLRLGELELSLERARISRQMTQLEYSRLQLEHNARQLGWTVNPDGTLSSTGTTTVRGSSSRRWLGKLGFGE